MVVASLSSFVEQHSDWALLLLFLLLALESFGLPLPGETVLLFASFLAFSQRELQFPWIIAVATIATTIGGCLGYGLGHYGGRPLLDLAPRYS